MPVIMADNRGRGVVRCIMSTNLTDCLLFVPPHGFTIIVDVQKQVADSACSLWPTIGGGVLLGVGCIMSTNLTGCLLFIPPHGFTVIVDVQEQVADSACHDGH